MTSEMNSALIAAGTNNVEWLNYRKVTDPRVPSPQSVELHMALKSSVSTPSFFRAM